MKRPTSVRIAAYRLPKKRQLPSVRIAVQSSPKKQLTSVLTAGRSRTREQPMRSPYNRPTKYLPVVGVPKDHPVGPKDHPVDRAVLLVDPRDLLGGQAVLLAGPGDHPAKKS